MKEKINSLLKKEFHLPIPESVKSSRAKFILQDLPKKDEIKTATKTFSSKEKFFFFIFASVFTISSAVILYDVNESFMIEKPVKGGELTEGIADVPRFINPILATGEADRDLSVLVYSGLLRATENGKYINDLAEKYDVSKDGLTYTFTIRENATWQDGVPVTADDIVFTIDKAKDPTLRSPKRALWEGVTVEPVGDKEIIFTLKQPYQSFLENTTMGILPKHKWKNIESNVFVHSELNMKAIGSGPYMIKSISRQLTSGTPEYIELIPFKNFALGEPKISKITLRFYPNQEKLVEAYQAGEIESANAISPAAADELKDSSGKIIESNLPRILAVFFNQTESKVLADKKVREALDMAIPKEEIVSTILHNYGDVLDGPIPPGSIGYKPTKETGTSTPEMKIESARKLLEKSGWKIDSKDGILTKVVSKKETLKLAITLSTIDFSELKNAAEMIKDSWQKMGAQVDLKIFEKGDLDKNVIEPRKYDALFFGEIVGRDLDMFSFWHSSQRKSPGVNISLYANTKADKILETLRAERDETKKIKLLADIQTEIRNDIPASFIYSPHFIYIVPNKIKNIKIIPPTTASDRFLNIYEWYTNTEKVWKIFK